MIRGRAVRSEMEIRESPEVPFGKASLVKANWLPSGVQSNSPRFGGKVISFCSAPPPDETV